MVNWFLPIYALSVYGLVRYCYRSAETDQRTVKWGPLEAVGVSLFIFFAAQIIGGLLIVFVPLLAGVDPRTLSTWLENNAVGQFTFMGLISLFTLGLLVFFLKRRRSRLADIGFKGRPNWGTLGRVVLGFVVYFAGILLVTMVAKGVFPDLDLDQEQQLGFKNPADWQLPLVFIGLVLLPPFVEEILVRGFLYTGLRQRLPRLAMYLVVSGLFGVAHLQAGSGEPLLWIGFLDTFVLSVVMINLRERTGNLWAPIGLHMLKNGIAFVSLFVIR